MRCFPAFCPNCGSIFPSVIPALPGTTILEDNSQTCPVCGYPYAHISDGVFKISEEALEIISAPDITRTMLEGASVNHQKCRRRKPFQETSNRKGRLRSPRAMPTYLRRR